MLEWLGGDIFSISFTRSVTRESQDKVNVKERGNTILLIYGSPSLMCSESNEKVLINSQFLFRLFKKGEFFKSTQQEKVNPSTFPYLSNQRE